MDHPPDIHETFLRAIDIGIIILSTNGRVVFWNDWMVRTSGIDRHNAKGRLLSELFPQTRGSRLDTALHDALKQGTAALLSSAWNYHALPLHAPNLPEQMLKQSLIIKPIQMTGQRYVSIEVFDVSNSAKREALLREKTHESQQAHQAAEAASRSKSEFVSTVSHELRSPLTAISGSLDLILGGVVGELNERLRGLLEIASSNSRLLLSLINDLLDIEKIEAGRMEFHFERVDLQRLLAATVANNRPYGDRHHIDYQLAATPVPVYVEADPQRLGQVVTNLLSNAAKFAYPNTAVHIGIETLAAGKVRVAVTNRGEGIPTPDQASVFNRYMQAGGESGRSRGTGLGLSISKAIIEHHGGGIGFVSIPQQTTTFYFDLALAAAVD